jgi:hypothetical protein
MRYSDYAPTGFDPRGLALPDRQEWLVLPVMRSRNSNVLDRVNFDVTLESLGGKSDTLEIHRFGHWACGWFELLLIHPDRETECDDIEGALADYPVLDDERYSDACYSETCNAWERMNIDDRIKILASHNVSIFASRRDELPELPYWDDIWIDE